MRDFDVALVRHLLIEGARELRDDALAKSIASWAYQGPGVWSGIDETILIGRQDVFEAGVEVAERIGSEISTDYLNTNAELPGGRWTNQQIVSEVVTLIRRFQEHLDARSQ